MHREYHEFYAVRVYLRSIRISLVSKDTFFTETGFPGVKKLNLSIRSFWTLISKAREALKISCSRAAGS